MGELHLEILVDRLRREFKCAANVGKPMVSYVETITKPARIEYLFDRDIAGKRHMVQLGIEVKPLERGAGRKVELSRAVKNSFTDSHLLTVIEQGLMDGIMTGVLARYPMTDIEATAASVVVTDLEAADEIALRGAAVMGFRDAALAAAPEFLEPIMKLEILVPPESVGEVLGDMNGRRGTVLNMTQRDDMQVVNARVPMAQMFGYATAIRSLTKGRASYSMEPDTFDLVPHNVHEEIMSR
jgi:elongation factor G